jgi:ketosteroid isomerase-like protein
MSNVHICDDERIGFRLMIMTSLRAFHFNGTGKRSLPGVLVAVFLIGCRQAPPPDPDAEFQALNEAVEAYYDGLSALRPDVAALYADDALVLRPRRIQISGRTELDEFVAGINRTPGFDVSYDTRFIELSSDATLGYSMAIVRVVRDGEDGKILVETSRDLHLWRKNLSGSWKLVLDIWNEYPSLND